MPEAAGRSSLDTMSITARKRKRTFQRIMSGLSKPGLVRFLTLTSSPESGEMQRDWRRLVMHLRRRGWMQDYIKVSEFTKGGLRHEHILYRGSYISQVYLSRLWESIHQAPVVWVKLAGQKRRTAGYLSKYMSKGTSARLCYSWSWVYRGFAGVWRRLVSCAVRYGTPWSRVLHVWEMMCRAGRSRSFEVLLWLEAG